MLVAKPLVTIPIPNMTPRSRVFAHMARISGYRIQWMLQYQHPSKIQAIWHGQSRAQRLHWNGLFGW